MGRLENNWRPNESQTLYVQSSPPLTTFPFETFQSTQSTIPSWAFHWRFFLLACTVLIIKVFPLPMITWSSSGPQQAQYTDWPIEAKQERKFPLLDQILTSPSSPAVNKAAPSWLHLINIMAPSWPLIFFSSLPDRAINRKVPSVQLMANESGACLPVDGNHAILVIKFVIVVILFPSFSPSGPHLHIIYQIISRYSWKPFTIGEVYTLSSLHEKSWQSGDQATAATISVCSSFIFTSSRIFNDLGKN